MIAHTLESVEAQRADNLESILAADQKARHTALTFSQRPIALGSIG